MLKRRKWNWIGNIVRRKAGDLAKHNFFTGIRMENVKIAVQNQHGSEVLQMKLKLEAKNGRKG